jgi:hypothetical protein
MLDRPDAAELLEALSAFLDEDLVPGLEGRLRFHALVAANVARILTRELRLGPQLAIAEIAELSALLACPGFNDEVTQSMEQDRESAIRELKRRLCEKIESGEMDEEPSRGLLKSYLKRSILRRLKIANPKFVR